MLFDPSGSLALGQIDSTADEKLHDEIRASRLLQSLLSDRSAGRSIYRRLHRHLELI